MTRHFRQRVNERIGNVDPDVLEAGIWWAIDNGRTDLVEFVKRIAKTGLRLFRFRVPDGRYFYALLDTSSRTAITVYVPGMKINPVGHKTLELAG